jgi:hypothetical protein
MSENPQEKPTEKLIRSVLVWRPGGFDNPLTAPGTPTSVCCLRSTRAGDWAAVYRAGSDQGIAGIYDFLSDACPQPPRGWAADGVLHRLDPYLPRADLLLDQHLAPVFIHIQGRRTLPLDAARRLTSMLPTPPFAARVEPQRDQLR